MTSEAYHQPVLLHEAIEGLQIESDGVYVDATFGGGGHSRAILQKLGEKGRLLAFDQDPDAAAQAPDDPRFQLIPENFRHLHRFLRLHNDTPHRYQNAGKRAQFWILSNEQSFWGNP